MGVALLLLVGTTGNPTEPGEACEGQQVGVTVGRGQVG